MQALRELLTGLPPGIVEAIQGAIVSAIVALIRARWPSLWALFGRHGRLVIVAVVASLWAGATGWAVAGLGGGALVAHVVVAFVAALGVRQVAKRG